VYQLLILHHHEAVLESTAAPLTSLHLELTFGLKMHKNALHVTTANGRLNDIVFLLEVGADVLDIRYNTTMNFEVLQRVLES
jgi:hypothetical protein